MDFMLFFITLFMFIMKLLHTISDAVTGSKQIVLVLSYNILVLEQQLAALQDTACNFLGQNVAWESYVRHLEQSRDQQSIAAQYYAKAAQHYAKAAQHYAELLSMGQHVVIDLLEQFAVAEANARSVQLELMGDLAEQTALNARQAAELEALRTAHAATLARVTQLEAEAKIQHSSALGAQVAYAQVTEAQALHIKELNEHVKKLKADVTLSAALQTEADAVNAQQGRRLQELSENVQTLQVDLAVSKAKHVQTEARYRSEATKDAVKIKALQVKIIQQRKSADDDFLKDKRQTAKIEELKVELDVIKNKAMAREAKLVTELAGKRARDAEVKKSSEVMDADVNAGPSNTTPPRCVCAMRSHRFQPVLLVDPKSTFAQASVAYPSAFTHDSRRIVQRGGDKFEAPLLLPAWPVERKREEFAESAAKRRKAF